MKHLFEKISTCHIAKRYGAKKNETPPQTSFKIDRDKDQQEDINRSPSVSIPYERHDIIKKRIALVVVDLYKKPLIPLF
jgi:hypothetical protein